MAVGDDAVAQGFPLVPNTGEEGRVRYGAREINRTRDFIAQIKSQMASIWPISKGGTGANNAEQALVNLGAAAANHTHDSRYYTESEINSKLATKADDPVVGGRAVGDVTSTNRIGLRWNGSNIVFKVDTTEFEVAKLIQLADVNGRKANAVENLDQARYAYGTTKAHAREAGSNRYAVWVDGGYQFGRATSSIRYKEAVENWDIDPQDVLALRPVSFHRKVDDAGVRDHGLIAEEVHKTLPQIIQWYLDPEKGDSEPQIDGIHYELLSVALLSVLKDHEKRIAELESQINNG